MIYKTMEAPSYYVLFVNRYDSTLVHIMFSDQICYCTLKRKPYYFGLVCIMYCLEGILFHIFSVYDFIERYGVRDINKLQEEA